MITVYLHDKGNSNNYQFGLKKLTSWFAPASHELKITYANGSIDIPINSEDLERLKNDIENYLQKLNQENI